MNARNTFNCSYSSPNARAGLPQGRDAHAVEFTEFEIAIEKVGEANMPTLWTTLIGFLRERGVVRVGYHHLPPMGAPDAADLRIFSEGFSDDLIQRYLAERRAGNAPVAQYAQRHPEPVYWDEIGRLKPLTEAERAYTEWVGRHGLIHGCGLQVFGPNGRNGFFALAFQPGLDRLDASDMRWVQLACQSAHLRYCSLLLPTLASPPDLSAREAEVLGWVAKGKSNAVIGEILGISAHTVDAHLRKIYLKLGVFDRITASLRGLGFGLLHSSG